MSFFNRRDFMDGKVSEIPIYYPIINWSVIGKFGTEKTDNKLGISHGKVAQIIKKFRSEEINKITNAIGLNDGSNCQIVNKFKTENINTVKSAGRD